MTRVSRLAAAAVAALVLAGCSDEAPAPEAAPAQTPAIQRDPYVYEPVRLATAYLALVEKPDALRALLIGDEAKRLQGPFERAGVQAFTVKDGGTYDLIVIACDEMSPDSCRRAMTMLADDGVIVWMMDVRGITFAQFRQRVESFTPAQLHLWMPGEGHWVLTGCRSSRAVKLASMLDAFSSERMFDDLAKARASTVPEVFASYVGTREDVLPVFALNDPQAEVQPECFVTRDLPTFDWVEDGAVDADIARRVREDMNLKQIARRLVMEGKMLSGAARERKDEDPAIDKLNAAAARNPNDLLLLERLDRLDRNARGFFELGKMLQAMKCYETMVLIKPTPLSLNNFGKCLEKLGKRELAEHAFKRAREMSHASALR